MPRVDDIPLNKFEINKILNRYPGLFHKKDGEMFFECSRISTKPLMFKHLGLGKIMAEDDDTTYDRNSISLYLDRCEGVLLLHDDVPILDVAECMSFYKHNINIRLNGFCRPSAYHKYDRVNITRQHTLNSIFND